MLFRLRLFIFQSVCALEGRSRDFHRYANDAWLKDLLVERLLLRFCPDASLLGFRLSEADMLRILK